MKSHRGYMPRKDSAKASWMHNFSVTVSAMPDELGLTPEEVAILISAAGKIEGAILDIFVKKTDYDAAVAYKEKVCAAEEKVIGNIIAALKKRKGFSPAAGASAGIMGSTKVQDLNEISPKLTHLKVSGFNVHITFLKKYTQGISLYSRVGGNKGPWVHLGYCTSPPFIDTRPAAKPGVPEMREYKARCLKNLQEVGQFSDVTSILVGGQIFHNGYNQAETGTTPAQESQA